MSKRTMSPPGPVLVTGSNGYVASWLVRKLLELGFDVHATVRDTRDPARTRHLEAIARGRSGTLSLCQPTFWIPTGSTKPCRAAESSPLPPKNSREAG